MSPSHRSTGFIKGSLRNVGFTLVELMVSVFITTLVALIAIGSYVMLLQQQNKAEKALSAYDGSTLIKQFIIKEIQSAGGDAVRPYAALWVEDNCVARNGFPHCDGSDRLTVLKIKTPIQSCRAAAVDAGNLDITLDPACCPLVGVWNDQIVVLTEGDRFWIRRTQVQSAVAPCVVRVLPSVFSDLSSSSAVGFPVWSFNGNAATPGPAEISSFTNPQLNLVTAQTFYLDSTTHELNRWRNSIGDPAANISAPDIDILAGNIFDLQFSIGYDIPPFDFRALDGLNANDEWLFNSGGDQWRAGGLANSLVTQLWMLQVGLSMGYRDSGLTTGSSLSILNGPERNFPGWSLVPSRVKVAPRNSLIFN